MRASAAAVILTAGLVVTSAPAQVSPPKPGVTPPPQTQLPAPGTTAVQRPFIASVKRTGPTAYTGSAALTFEAEITNPTSKLLETNLFADRFEPGQQALVARRAVGRDGKAVVQVPANGRATVTFSDAGGLDNGCAANYYLLTLEDQGSTNLKLTPTCAFGVTENDPLDGTPPDHVVRQTSGKVHYHTPKNLSRKPTCGNAIVFEATVKNATAAEADVALAITTAGGGPTSFPLAVAPLAANQERTRRAASTFFKGQAGKWELRIVPPIRSSGSSAGGAPQEAPATAGGPPIFQRRFGVDITRLCSIKTELNATVEAPPAPPSYRGE